MRQKKLTLLFHKLQNNFSKKKLFGEIEEYANDGMEKVIQNK